MNFNVKINPCVTVNLPYESDVESGLSYSPADMSRLTAENRAVKMQELQTLMYHDSLPPDAEVPLDLRRGVDENILWNRASLVNDSLKDFQRKKSQSNKTNLSSSN